MKECIGFSEGPPCSLWPSSASCPKGWSRSYGAIAMTPNNLVDHFNGYYIPGDNCKVKTGMLVILTEITKLTKLFNTICKITIMTPLDTLIRRN